MRAFYRLLKFEFQSWFRAISLLCFGSVVCPLIFLHAAVRDFNAYSVHERFEHIYASAGCIFVFWTFFAALCGFFVKTVYSSYWGSKSVYTYLTLPVKRKALYFSKLTVLTVCLLLLWAAQLIGIRLGYSVAAPGAGDESFSMSNGLFLAFIRSDFFRFVLPLTISRFISTAAVFLAIATGLYYAILCERSRRWWGLAAVLAAAGIIVRVLGYRMNESIHAADPSGLYMSSTLLVLLSAFFVWHSLRIMNKGAIA